MTTTHTFIEVLRITIRKLTQYTSNYHLFILINVFAIGINHFFNNWFQNFIIKIIYRLKGIDNTSWFISIFYTINR